MHINCGSRARGASQLASRGGGCRAGGRQLTAASPPSIVTAVAIAALAIAGVAILATIPAAIVTAAIIGPIADDAGGHVDDVMSCLALDGVSK